MLNQGMSQKQVFPAHAGMSLPALQAGRPATGFPRSRGDEPQLDALGIIEW